jgi:DNA-binding MarR family transcriptional regulator
MTRVQTTSDSFTPRVVRPAAVDWVKFDADLARDGSVDPVDKALYAALASFADQGDRVTSDEDDIPTRARLAECIGRSVDTVDRATKRLEAIGLVRVERRRDPSNPKRHLPSVYELADAEWWDERAARRAEARRAARSARESARVEAREARGGGRMDAARGSRTGAARGGRMDAAVPSSLKKGEKETSSSCVTPVTAAAPAALKEGEATAPPDEQRTGPSAEAFAAVDAATSQWDGLRLPNAQERLRLAERVSEALVQGASRVGVHDALTRDLEPSRTRSAVAVVMSRTTAPGWADLPGIGQGVTAARPALPPPCGRCDHNRMVDIETPDGPRARRCPACHPLVDRTAADDDGQDDGVTVYAEIEFDDDGAEVIPLHRAAD